MHQIVSGRDGLTYTNAWQPPLPFHDSHKALATKKTLKMAHFGLHFRSNGAFSAILARPFKITRLYLSKNYSRWQQKSFLKTTLSIVILNFVIVKAGKERNNRASDVYDRSCNTVLR